MFIYLFIFAIIVTVCDSISVRDVYRRQLARERQTSRLARGQRTYHNVAYNPPIYHNVAYNPQPYDYSIIDESAYMDAFTGGFQRPIGTVAGVPIWPSSYQKNIDADDSLFFDENGSAFRVPRQMSFREIRHSVRGINGGIRSNRQY